MLLAFQGLECLCSVSIRFNLFVPEGRLVMIVHIASNIRGTHVTPCLWLKLFVLIFRSHGEPSQMRGVHCQISSFHDDIIGEYFYGPPETGRPKSVY